MKFKCGVLPLLIETGRYKDIPRELRTCKICDSGSVESEHHFLMECTSLQEVRSRHKALLPAPCTDINIGMPEGMK